MRVVLTGGAGLVGSNLTQYQTGLEPDDPPWVVDSITGRNAKIHVAGSSSVRLVCTLGDPTQLRIYPKFEPVSHDGPRGRGPDGSPRRKP